MPRTLKCQTNTEEMEARIAEAFNAWRPGGMHPAPTTYFEHGQWWVTCNDCSGQWSAVDASGPGTVDGFDFECVTEPEEDSLCGDEASDAE
jgi:hypothetical protein